MARIGIRVPARNHRTTPEQHDCFVLLVLHVNFKCDHTGCWPTLSGLVLAQTDNAGGGRQGVTNEGRSLELHTAIEQITHDPLRRNSALTDSQVTDQRRVHQCSRVSGDRLREHMIQRQTQSITKHRLVNSGMPLCNSNCGNVAVVVPDFKIFKPGNCDCHCDLPRAEIGQTSSTRPLR